MKKRIPWETDDYCKQRKLLHESTERKCSQSSTYDIMHVNKAHKSLNLSYEQEQVEYVKN